MPRSSDNYGNGVFSGKTQRLLGGAGACKFDNHVEIGGFFPFDTIILVKTRNNKKVVDFVERGNFAS